MTYTVQQGDTLYAIARKFQVNVADLKARNQLTNNSLHIGQTLYIPQTKQNQEINNALHTVRPGESLYSIARKYQLSVTELKSLNQLRNDFLSVGQVLKIKSSIANPIPTKDITHKSTHTVQAGESLYSIARKYNVSLHQLRLWNELKSDFLRVGQTLWLSTKTEAPSNTSQGFHKVKAGESLYAIARKYQISINQIRTWNNLQSDYLRIGQEIRVQAKEPSQPEKPPVQDKPVNTEPNMHIVQKGETLYSIARTYKLSIHQIRAINQLETDNLQVGQKLWVALEEDNQEEEKQKEKIETSDIEIYTVVAGDNLYSIAQKYNMTVAYIRQINHLETNSIQIGQELKVIRQSSNNQNTNSQVGNTYIENKVDIENLPEQIQKIIENRKIIEVKAMNGESTFMSGLKRNVGRNQINRPDDLDKVQKRLIQLGMLSPYHEESPAQLRRSAITSNLIPQTIQAIERFQQRYKVRFWLERATRIKMMGTNMYAQGVIMPNDITYKVLRELTHYTISFPNPVNRQTTTVQFNDFPVSSFTVFYKGVSFVGHSSPEVPMSVFNRLGLNNELAEALKFVSKHEGNFDAINSYDKAIFSYGFIQFAGNGGGLAPFLASVKEKGTKAFEQYFSRFGIDVEYRLYNGQIRDAEVLVMNPYAKDGNYLQKGQEAERVLRADKQLHGVFVRAGYAAPIITMQIDSAITAYVNPALAIRSNIIAGNLSLSNILLKEVIRTPMGLAVMIDTTINRWINQTRKIFRQAIEQVAIADRLYTEEALMNIDERKVLKQIIANNQNDKRITKRVGSILNSKLRSSKQLVL